MSTFETLVVSEVEVDGDESMASEADIIMKREVVMWICKDRKYVWMDGGFYAYKANYVENKGSFGIDKNTEQWH